MSTPRDVAFCLLGTEALSRHLSELCYMKRFIPNLNTLKNLVSIQGKDQSEFADSDAVEKLKEDSDVLR